MKYSLISATSFFALFAAAACPGYAAEVMSAPVQTNLYDLVHDGMTSADGGDATVSSVSPLVSAVEALEMATVTWQTASFTGPVDLAASPNVAFPRVPLGAAPGTRPDDDFATPITGAWQWNAVQKAHALGVAHLAPLIGTIGNGPAATDKTGDTVFVAAASRPTFGDGDNGEGGVRSSSVAMAYAPSSTNTATITVAGAGNFRQRGDTGFSVAAANSLRSTPVSEPAAAGGVALSEAAPPTLGYNYTPAVSGTKGNAVEASFSDAITASGAFAQLNAPVTTSTFQTSELQSGRGQTVRAPMEKSRPASFRRAEARPLTGRSKRAIFKASAVSRSAPRTARSRPANGIRARPGPSNSRPVMSPRRTASCST